jgi:hypothetical protein
MLDSLTSCCPFPRPRRNKTLPSQELASTEAHVLQSRMTPADEVRRDDDETRLEDVTGIEAPVPLSNAPPADDAQKKEINSQMEHLWHEAGQQFQDICGKSLGLEASESYTINSLRNKIREADSKVQYQDQPIQKTKREKTKSVVLDVLNFLGKTTKVVSAAGEFVSADYPDVLLLS